MPPCLWGELVHFTALSVTAHPLTGAQRTGPEPHTVSGGRWLPSKKAADTYKRQLEQMFLNFEVLHDITPPLTPPTLYSATLTPEALHNISLSLTAPICSATLLPAPLTPATMVILTRLALLPPQGLCACRVACHLPRKLLHLPLSNLVLCSLL